MHKVEISVIELLALQKLAIIGHTLAGQIAGKATEEMQALVGVLDKIIARAKSAA
jgi:hypothetical protein